MGSHRCVDGDFFILFAGVSRHFDFHRPWNGHAGGALELIFALHLKIKLHGDCTGEAHGHGMGIELFEFVFKPEFGLSISPKNNPTD